MVVTPKNPLMLDPNRIFVTEQDNSLRTIVNLKEIRNAFGQQALEWKKGAIRTLAIGTTSEKEEDLKISFVEKQQIVPVTMEDVNRFRETLTVSDEDHKLAGTIPSPYDYSEMTNDQKECLRLCETITGIITLNPEWKDDSTQFHTVQMCLSILFSLHHSSDVILMFIGDVTSVENYVRPLRLGVIATVDNVDAVINATDAGAELAYASKGVDVTVGEDGVEEIDIAPHED